MIEGIASEVLLQRFAVEIVDPRRAGFIEITPRPSIRREGEK